MNEIGFTLADPGTLNVFINNDHIGVIRKVSGLFTFVPGKKRRNLGADALRALAAKIEMMEKVHH